MPQENQNDDFSIAKCQIYLKPCCKFDFVCFLETYLRKFINLDDGGTPDDPFSPRVPKSTSRGPFRHPFWASMKSKRNKFEIVWMLPLCPKIDDPVCIIMKHEHE